MLNCNTTAGIQPIIQGLAWLVECIDYMRFFPGDFSPSRWDFNAHITRGLGGIDLIATVHSETHHNSLSYLQ
ncbi:Uncharacterised protein [Enterobacter hormaechei]|nr:Uncharacterised protein [Enterobacter hormaechei]VAE26738.1 Uncharacterised protein [Enterobacter hormaechei]